MGKRTNFEIAVSLRAVQGVLLVAVINGAADLAIALGTRKPGYVVMSSVVLLVIYCFGLVAQHVATGDVEERMDDTAQPYALAKED